MHAQLHAVENLAGGVGKHQRFALGGGQLEVRVAVALHGGVQAGAVYAHVLAGRDGGSGGKLPLARLGRIVRKSPRAEVDGLRRGVVQLNPVIGSLADVRRGGRGHDLVKKNAA